MKQETKTIEYNLVASEFDWEIKPGKIIRAWGFNNQVPGPVLRARKGDTLVINLVNHLPESTMIHWHGIRLPGKVLNTGLQYRMPELSGIIHTRMKPFKWKEGCTGVLLLKRNLTCWWTMKNCCCWMI
jgi:hypothetical protein